MPLLSTLAGARGFGRLFQAAGSTNAYEWLETISVGAGGTSSITFSNLNTNYGSTYQHLQLRITARTSRTNADSDPILIRFNNDTGNNYSRHGLRAYFGTIDSVGSTSQNGIFLTESCAVDKNAANVFSPVVADILNPFEARQKTVQATSGLLASGWYGTEFWSGNWANTSATTTITLLPLIGPNFVSGSRFSLYGMRIA